MPLVYVNQIAAMGDGDGDECVQALEERLLKEIVHSEYVSPVSPKVLHRWGHQTAGGDTFTAPTAPAPTPAPTSDALELARAAIQTPSVLEEAGTNPIVAKLVSRMSAPHLARALATPVDSRRHGLFTSFPRTIVVVGDAERLTREIGDLVAAMEKDGVDVETVWAPDAAHDILIMAPGWWDDNVIEEVWRRVGVWMGKMRSRALL
jgi:acetyl esterase/lipase